MVVAVRHLLKARGRCPIRVDGSRQADLIQLHKVAVADTEAVLAALLQGLFICLSVVQLAILQQTGQDGKGAALGAIVTPGGGNNVLYAVFLGVGQLIGGDLVGEIVLGGITGPTPAAASKPQLPIGAGMLLEHMTQSYMYSRIACRMRHRQTVQI